MPLGWSKVEKEASTFKKNRSTFGTMRTQKTYTLKGKEMSVYQTLRKLEKKSERFNTLGSGNLLAIVEVPEDMINDSIGAIADREPDMALPELEKLAAVEAEKEWLAANTVDFFNEVSLLYGMVENFHHQSSRIASYRELQEEWKTKKKTIRLPPFNKGFPEGFVHASLNGDGDGIVYVNNVIVWLEDIIDNPGVFPELEDETFPDDFKTKYLPEMFKKMLRIFAIVYSVCWPIVVEYEADAHINTCFKHFYFFMKRYNLLKKKSDLSMFHMPRIKKMVDLSKMDEEYTKCKALLEEGKKKKE
mmetsp:Transcript_5459/g.6905  ORF Transcript_5459/g.6905 Transcript_5459/m.6905 type:complete len:303 (+) Transcript_5459:202-1110(+)|eukprot:CAMPEP_0204832236 /NCGR_PEP_ID=MMETSP1346-20131115/12890_1 /ASSEMBLY_ACC=CAM_ASM_000771 /TAXON_ID=215587 /ORGANISM="Aplanochytrium stocchinoi, Strain GSBS06" /LENGTH=302 /DNA_ID=CAMNT_0051963883 /DNA_START=71 /DNA_END=979 /DNA_ORIENTATION=-